MRKKIHQTIMLIPAVAILAACGPAPTPTSSLVAVPPAPIVKVTAPTNLPPTVATSAAPQVEAAPQRTDRMKIRIMLEDVELTASLVDSQTTRDFVSLLPLTLTLEDYAGTEKISYLPRKLSTEDAPAGCDPAVGDITYYAPWGNLAIFYRDFGYAEGLVILGKIDGNLETLDVPGSIEATIEFLE